TLRRVNSATPLKLNVVLPPRFPLRSSSPSELGDPIEARLRDRGRQATPPLRRVNSATPLKRAELAARVVDAEASSPSELGDPIEATSEIVVFSEDPALFAE